MESTCSEEQFQQQCIVHFQPALWHWGCYWLLLGEAANSLVNERPLDEIFYLLDPSLRPVPPCMSSQISMKVYQEHATMAKEYLEVQKELQWLNKYKSELLEQLQKTRAEQRRREGIGRSSSPTELQRSVEEYVQLQEEKDSLVQLHRSLKEQLTKVRSQHQQQQHQQQQQLQPQLQQSQQQQQRPPPLPDDGWVVVSRT